LVQSGDGDGGGANSVNAAALSGCHRRERGMDEILMKSEGAQRYISMEYQVLLQLQGRCVSSCSNCVDVSPADFDRGCVHVPHTVDRKKKTKKKILKR
jgi:hypothetical protein